MAFDSNQLGMAIFLLIAAFFNIWFVITSYRRAFFTPKANQKYSRSRAGVLSIISTPFKCSGNYGIIPHTHPLLYGKHLFEKPSAGKETFHDKDIEHEFNEETPDIA